MRPLHSEWGPRVESRGGVTSFTQSQQVRERITVGAGEVAQMDPSAKLETYQGWVVVTLERWGVTSVVWGKGTLMGWRNKQWQKSLSSLASSLALGSGRNPVSRGEGEGDCGRQWTSLASTPTNMCTRL